MPTRRPSRGRNRDNDDHRVIRLISGSPSMNRNDNRRNPQARCLWLDAPGEVVSREDYIHFFPGGKSWGKLYLSEGKIDFKGSLRRSVEILFDVTIKEILWSYISSINQALSSGARLKDLSNRVDQVKLVFSKNHREVEVAVKWSTRSALVEGPMTPGGERFFNHLRKRIEDELSLHQWWSLSLEEEFFSRRVSP